MNNTTSATQNAEPSTSASTTNTTTHVYIGIDVSKDTLHVDADKLFKGPVNNTPREIEKFLTTLLKKSKGQEKPWLCIESTGPYGRPLLDACFKRDIPISQVNPRFVKAHATSKGILYKTDRTDAHIIRSFAEQNNPPPTRPLDPARQRLRELHLVRDGYTKDITRQENLLPSITLPQMRKRLQATLRTLRRIVGELEQQIEHTALKEDAAIAGLVGALCEIKGVGVLTASKIVAHVPELGSLGRRSSAYLSGLAPMPDESGTLSGPRKIKGGRWHVRQGLYMAAHCAAIHNEDLRKVYQRLVARGKLRKVALIAVMRKLFAHMDRVARKHLNPPEAPMV